MICVSKCSARLDAALMPLLEHHVPEVDGNFNVCLELLSCPAVHVKVSVASTPLFSVLLPVAYSRSMHLVYGWFVNIFSPYSPFPLTALRGLVALVSIFFMAS